MTKSVVFIDGQNLYKRLRDIALVEKDINWTKVFEYLLPAGGRLIRAYWYQPARVAPWEWNPAYHAKRCPASMALGDFQAQAEAFYSAERQRLEDMQKKIYARLEEDFECVEFRYSGVLKLDPIGTWVDPKGVTKVGRRVGEKGVDVALAVDLFRFSENYEHAVLLSGDFDYVPAIQAVKDRLRGITVVPVMSGAPPSAPGHARRLRGMSDFEKPLYETDLKGMFKR